MLGKGSESCLDLSGKNEETELGYTQSLETGPGLTQSKVCSLKTWPMPVQCKIERLWQLKPSKLGWACSIAVCVCFMSNRFMIGPLVHQL